MATERADSRRTRVRIVEASRRLLEQSPTAPVADVAAAAGVSRSTLYRHFPDRDSLLRAARAHQPREPENARSDSLPPGRLGRERPVSLGGHPCVRCRVSSRVPEQLSPRRSGSRMSRWRCMCSTSTVRICCGSRPGALCPSASKRRWRSGLSSIGRVVAVACRAGGPAGNRGRAAVAARASDGRDAHPWAPTSAVGGDRAPGGGRDHACRPVHGHVRAGAATQAAACGGGDPAEPAAAAHLAHLRRRGGGNVLPATRSRGLVRLRREPRRRVDHARRRLGPEHAAAASSAVALGALRPAGAVAARRRTR